MTDQTSSHDGAAGLGHEVKLLVDMVVEHSAPWLERVKATAPGPGDRSEPQPEAHADGQPGSNCVGWCPVCTAVGVAKGQPPEFTAKAFEQAAQMVALLRAVLADRWHPEQGVHMPGFAPEAPQAARSEPPSVQADAERIRPVAGNGQRNGARVQHFAVRKAAPADAGEHQP